jgi:hypothetical protein
MMANRFSKFKDFLKFESLKHPGFWQEKFNEPLGVILPIFTVFTGILAGLGAITNSDSLREKETILKNLDPSNHQELISSTPHLKNIQDNCIVTINGDPKKIGELTSSFSVINKEALPSQEPSTNMTIDSAEIKNCFLQVADHTRLDQYKNTMTAIMVLPLTTAFAFSFGYFFLTTREDREKHKDAWKKYKAQETTGHGQSLG